jgi:hypothetical protein
MVSMRRIAAITFALALGAAFPAPPAAVAAESPVASAQCPRGDTTITKQIRFGRGRTTAVVKDTIRLCTSHDYHLRARAGQTMSVHLAAGRKTSFSIYAPTDPVEGADGVRDWSGELPETGDYIITVGTDATAAYTLEVTIR